MHSGTSWSGNELVRPAREFSDTVSPQETLITMRLLPERTRTWIRVQRRRREGIDRLRKADVVVVCHAKSGQTWLRTMISHIYHLSYGVPVGELLKFDNFQAYDPAIPKIYITKDTRLPRGTGSRRKEYVSPEKKVVLLVRDPRDTVVSFYFHVRNRAPRIELAAKGIPESARNMPIFDFVMDQTMGLPNVMELMNRWEREIRSLPRSLLVRYEDMHADPKDQLGRVTAFIGSEATPDQIAKAVDFASFDRLKEKERSGFFSGDRLRPTNPSNPDSFKVRRGKIGGYMEYFDSEQIATIDDLVKSRLTGYYGYE